MRNVLLLAAALFLGAAIAVLGEAHLALRAGEPAYYAYSDHHVSEVVPATDAPRAPTIASQPDAIPVRTNRRSGAPYAFALASGPLLLANAVLPSTPLLFSQFVAFFSG